MKREKIRASRGWTWDFGDGHTIYLDAIYPTRAEARKAAKASYWQTHPPRVVPIELRPVTRRAR